MEANSVQSQTCYILNITAHNGIWASDNPFDESTPHFIFQLMVILLITRLLYFIFRHLRPPRMILDLFAGILIGPSVFGKTGYFIQFFPTRSISTLETLAYFALTLHAFFIGLEMDVKPIARAGRKIIIFSMAAFFLSMTLAIALFFINRALLSLNNDEAPIGGCVYWAVSLTITGFPVVAEILADLRLLQTEIGKLSLPIALFTDLSCWVVVGIILPVCFNPSNSPFAIATTLAFVLTSIYVVRPILELILELTSHTTNTYGEYYLSFFLVGAVICSFVTGASGAHQIIGAFVCGVALPINDELRFELIERFEDFVSGVMMPVFFAICGVRIDIFQVGNWGLAFFVVIMACGIKLAGYVLVSLIYGMPTREGLALGILMNSKGILAVVMLNIGWDKKVYSLSLSLYIYIYIYIFFADTYGCFYFVDDKLLRSEEYAVMVLAILLMTMVVAPIISSMYRPWRSHHKLRTIQKLKPNSILKIFACVYSISSVPSIINFLHLYNPTKQSPLRVFALHLVELTGRASAMLIVHSSSRRRPLRAIRDTASLSDDIISAFHQFEIHNSSVSIFPLTSVSPFSAMHEDICSLAEDKRAAILILPFHKDDSEVNPVLHGVNRNVLDNAPCTVGILVDRCATYKNYEEEGRNVVVLFIGGPDDREALAYAWKMAGQPGVFVTLIRFILTSDYNDSINGESLPITSPTHVAYPVSDTVKQREIDDDYINEFRLGTVSEDRVSYEEKLLRNAEETVSAVLKTMEIGYDLYLVGRGKGWFSPLTAGLLEWSDCQELGPMGDLLTGSANANGSVLVVQQYVNGYEISSNFNRTVDDDNGMCDNGEYKESVKSNTRQFSAEDENSVFNYRLYSRKRYTNVDYYEDAEEEREEDEEYNKDHSRVGDDGD